MYFNASGLTGMADELRAWMGTWDWDTKAITETWVSEGQDMQLNVPGYRCDRKDRTGCKSGGRVAFLIRENITAVLRGNISEDSPTESIWVELKNKKGEITLRGLYYRPPNSQQDIVRRLQIAARKIGW